MAARWLLAGGLRAVMDVFAQGFPVSEAARRAQQYDSCGVVAHSGQGPARRFDENLRGAGAIPDPGQPANDTRSDA